LTTTESVIVEIPKEESSASAMGSTMEYWRAFSAHAKAMWLYETLV